MQELRGSLSLEGLDIYVPIVCLSLAPFSSMEPQAMDSCLPVLKWESSS